MPHKKLVSTCLLSLLSGALSFLPAAVAEEPAAAAETAAAPDIQGIINMLSEKGLSIDAAAAQEAAMDAVIRTADPGGRMLTPEEVEKLKTVRDGNVLGAAFHLSMSNGLPVVASVDGASDEDDAILAPGDVLLQVGDEPWSRTDIVTVLRALRGGDALKLEVVVLQEGLVTNRVEITREAQQLPGIELAEMLPAKICYAKLNGLYPGTGDELLTTIDGWRTNDCAGLILDLRDAGGSDVESAAKVASLYAEGQTMIFAFRDSQDQDLEVFKADPLPPLGMPTMVLINTNTVGAAEVLAAAMKRSPRGAMLLGAPTYGDPEIRSGIELSDGRMLYVSTRRLSSADGTLYTGAHGVEPDVAVSSRLVAEPYEPEQVLSARRKTLDEELEDKQLSTKVKGDAVLRRGVDILLGLKALNIRGIQNAQNPSR